MQILSMENTTQKILRKAEVWQLHEHTPIMANRTPTLILMHNNLKLFDDFEGKLTNLKMGSRLSKLNSLPTQPYVT